MYTARYLTALATIMERPTEINKRTGIKTRRHFGLNFSIEDALGVPVLACRKMFPKTAAAELAWSLLGTKDTAFISKYSKIWEKFEDSPGIVECAYGYRWRKHFGRDQLKEAVTLLKNDPSSRQGVVVAWDPSSDGLSRQGLLKNVPCPFAFCVNIMDGKLNLAVYQRSADMVAGFPYDFMFYALLQDAVSTELNISNGGLIFSIADAHIYENHFNIVENMLAKTHLENAYIKMPAVKMSIIEWNPDNYVALVDKLCANRVDPAYSPKIEIAQ